MRPLAGNKTFRRFNQIDSHPWRVLFAASIEFPRTLVDSLTAAGFFIERPGTPKEALKNLSGRQFDLVFLDAEFCGSASQTCRTIRGMAPDLGIIILRDGGESEHDFLALDAGADDCICAPFRFREMVARIGAVLRRNKTPDASNASALRAGDLELDIKHRRLRRSGLDIHLSAVEFDLLLFLMRNQGVPLTHLKLLHAVWRDSSSCNSHLLRFYIGLLRRKIEPDPARPQYILTEPWVGYQFRNP